MAPWTKVATASAVGLLFAMVPVAAFHARGIEADELLRDPAAEFKIPIHAGLVSWLGISTLVATSAITGFCASVTSRGRIQLLTASAFSALLALDDALMLHEGVWEKALGLEEDVIFAFYGLALVALALSIRRDPPSTGAAGILIPAGLLAISVLIDTLGNSSPPGEAVAAMEDLAKFAGFVGWAAYWSVTSRAFLVADRR